MKKVLALILALVMVCALCACGGGSDSKDASAGGGDDFAAWKVYIKEYVVAGAPSEEAGKAVTEQLDAATTVEEVDAIPALSVMFGSVGALHYDAWIAAGKPAADTSNMGDPSTASFEPTGEPAN